MVEDFFALIERLGKSYPHFPDGRIDFSTAATIPALSCFVFFEKKLLVLKRSDKVGFLKNRWHVIGGFLDEPRPITDKAVEELREETGVGADFVERISVEEPLMDIEDGRTWIVYPVMIVLKSRPEIKLDWEHTECAWIDVADAPKYDLLPSVMQNLEAFERKL